MLNFKKIKINLNIFLFWSFIFLMLQEYAFGGEAFVFSPTSDREAIAEFDYLLESKAKLSVDEIVKGDAGSFSKGTKKTWGFGYFDEALWIRFSVDLSNYKDTYWFFISNYEHVGILEFFYENESGKFEKFKLTEKQPLEDRIFQIHNYLFKIPVFKKEVVTYYVRIVPHGHVLTADFSWASTSGILKHMQDMHMGVGMFFGGLVVMLAYNAVIFFYLKSRSYFYYIYYLSSFILFFVYLNGLAPFFTNWTPFLEKFYASCGYAAIHGLILLGRHILLLCNSDKKLNIYLDLYLKIGQWIAFVGAVLTFFMPIGLPYQILNGVILGVVPVLMFSGIKRSFEGFMPAKIYSLGWLMFSMGLAAVSMRLIGWIPSNWITNYSVQIASVLEAIIFAVALAYRIKLVEKEKKAALDEHAKHKLEMLEGERARLEQRVAERTESLEASLKSRRMMLANASHELRTPVNALRLLLDSGSNHLASNVGIISNVSTITNHMSQLVENLLLLDEGAQADQRGPIKDFDLGDEIRATATMLGPLRHGSAATFNLDVDVCLGVMVRGDLTSLRRVIINLLSNAFKFTERGLVTLTAAVGDTSDEGKTHCIIKVVDTGSGIPANMHDQIFGAFVTSGGQGGHTGTGLGLAISRQLAHNMDGSLILVRSAPDVGSKFEFHACFEAAAYHEAEPPHGQPALPQAAPCGRRLNVLLAEDDPITAQAVQLIVRQLQHDVTHVATYEELRQALMQADTAYDIALIDHRLPGGNGLGAIIDCRALGRATTTRMVLVTADVTPEVLDAAREICDGIVTKPTTAHVLRQLLGEGPRTASLLADTSAVVDVEPLKMLGRCGAKPDALARMCATFNQTVSETLADIEVRLTASGETRSALAELEPHIHRMRGSCATVGATALAEEFRKLAACDSRMTAQRQYALMVDTFHSTSKALDALLATLQTA